MFALKTVVLFLVSFSGKLALISKTSSRLPFGYFVTRRQSEKPRNYSLVV